jgi:hypothetical protein
MSYFRAKPETSGFISVELWVQNSANCSCEFVVPTIKINPVQQSLRNAPLFMNL